MYLKLNYSRTSPIADGYVLTTHTVAGIKEQDTETVIYYYVYEDDFFDKFLQRCSIALEKGNLTDEEYKEKCAELGVYNTEPTNTVAKEVTEKTVYIEYTDENVAKLAAIYALGDDVKIDDYKDYLKASIKDHYKRKLATKAPFETSDGTVIDFSSVHIANLEQIIRVMGDVFSFRIYDNSFVEIDKQKATQWLTELIEHEIQLRNDQWSQIDAVDKATSYVELEAVRKSVFDGDISD